LAWRVGEVAGLAALSTPLLTFEALACSTCIGWGKDGQVWSGGFIWSTLVLMVLPFVLAGVVGGWVYHLHRRAARLRHGTATASRLVLPQKESGQ
jgi:hypothetical protein